MFIFFVIGASRLRRQKSHRVHLLHSKGTNRPSPSRWASFAERKCLVPIFFFFCFLSSSMCLHIIPILPGGGPIKRFSIRLSPSSSPRLKPLTTWGYYVCAGRRAAGQLGSRASRPGGVQEEEAPTNRGFLSSKPAKLIATFHTRTTTASAEVTAFVQLVEKLFLLHPAQSRSCNQ